MGGRRVYIPKSVTSEHPFAAIIGLESLLKPGSVYGGEDHFQRHKAESALFGTSHCFDCGNLRHQQSRSLGGYRAGAN